jgi:hypothetical protein
VTTSDPAPETAAVTITGPATPEDVAAVVAVLAAAGSAGDPQPTRATTWASHAVAVRHPVGHGPGAWRATYRY